MLILMNLLTLALLFLGTKAPSCTASTFTFEEIGKDEFVVTLNGIKIFHHSKANPVIYIGTGQTNFSGSKSNFRIEDFLTSRVPLVEWTPHNNDDTDEFERIEFQCCGVDHYIEFSLRQTQGHTLVLSVVGHSNSFDHVWLRLVADTDEHVYGGGGQFTYFNLRHQSFPVWAREQGVGRNKSTLVTFFSDLNGDFGGDYHTTHFPQPTFISSRNYSFHYSGSRYSVLDFSHQQFHEVLFLGIPRTIYLQEESSPSKLVSRLTQFLGRQPSLPEWVQDGAILGIHGGIKKMRAFIQQAEESRVALSGVLIHDWTGYKNTTTGRHVFLNWRWSSQQYPGLSEEISHLSKRGIRVLAYINPHLEQSGSLFKIAEAKGYLLKTMTNVTYLSEIGGVHCGTIDLTNPVAYDWFKDEIIKKNLIGFGFAGWMADMGENLPTEGVVLHSGRSPTDLHNDWPVLWAKLNRQAVEESGKLGEVVFWVKNGFTGAGNYSTLMWAGEQNVDFSLSDGIASTVVAALSMGMSGVGLTHFDIGGFTTIDTLSPPLVRTEECLLRSAEMAVFTPMFRTSEGSKPSSNVQYYSSHGTLRKFARLSRMFSVLQNYTRHVVNLTATSGLPAQRPLFLHYPADSASLDINYQYMFGPDVLVAPVYLPDVEFWDVYLPFDLEGVWVFLWDDSVTYVGGRTVRVPAPIGQPPVFYRNTSLFVDVFRRVAAETPVNLPPYFLQLQNNTTSAIAQDFPTALSPSTLHPATTRFSSATAPLVVQPAIKEAHVMQNFPAERVVRCHSAVVHHSFVLNLLSLLILFVCSYEDLFLHLLRDFA